MKSATAYQQLSLNVHLNDDATFDNYHVSENSPNDVARRAVMSLLDDRPADPFVYVWGPEGVGVTHLLQAACHGADQRGLRSQYLPLEELAGFAAQQLLEGLEQLDLVCLDGLQHVLGQPGWDHALFHFYNRLHEQRLHEPGGCRLLASADCAPRDLGSALPDLVSRMGWGTAFRLQALDDDDKRRALALRARARGLDLSDEVIGFIMHRGSRDMMELFDCLQRLDNLSLTEKRRITVPFVKDALGW